MRTLFLIMLLAGASITAAAGDTTPAQLLEGWRAQAGASAAFSATRGRQLFERTGRDWSCVTCHTSDPRAPGRHKVTGKAILPLAPAINPQRFSDAAKVEKWFRRNCRDVLERECTATEKGDLLSWLLTVH